jgi:transposase
MERKVKYNYEFKLRCVEEVLKRHQSVNSVSILNGLQESNLRKWVNFYRKYGPGGLLPRRKQNYHPDFKLKVLQAIDKDLLSLSEACLKFNISSDSVIVTWQKNYLKEGFNGLINKPKGRPIMNFKRAKTKSDKPLTKEEELLLEIESLRCENELLKKFNALIQAKKSLGQKKPRP